MAKFNPFGLFGETDTQFQQKVSNQQSGKYNQLVQQELGQQQGYAGQAGNIYNQLLGYGQQDRNLMNQNLGPLMNLYSQAAGLPYQMQGQGQASPSVRDARLQTANAMGAQAPPGRTVTPNLSRGGMGTTENRSRDPGGALNPTVVPQTASAQVAQQAQANNNMWGLTPAQQVELNTQTQAYSQAESAALQDFRTSYLARGMTPPAEGEAMIKQQYANQALSAQAQFAESARANRQAAAQQMLSMVMALGEEGTQEVGAAGAGLAGLGGQAASLAGSFAGLGQGAQQMAMQAAQASQSSQDSLLSGGMGLLGAFLGGAFNKTPAINIQGLPTLGTPPIAGSGGGDGVGGGGLGPMQPAPVTGFNVQNIGDAFKKLVS